VPEFDMNDMEHDETVDGPREKPRVNHGSGREQVGELTVANTNAASFMRTNVATAGGVTEVVRRMLIERSIHGPVTPDANLREVGLTSLDMVDLVLSIECEFDLQIPEAQITPANFRSIATIDALISTLRS
jgi:acyl carrier protein